jgi:hypothetical protein
LILSSVAFQTVTNQKSPCIRDEIGRGYGNARSFAIFRIFFLNTFVLQRPRRVFGHSGVSFNQSIIAIDRNKVIE